MSDAIRLEDIDVASIKFRECLQCVNVGCSDECDECESGELFEQSEEALDFTE